MSYLDLIAAAETPAKVQSDWTLDANQVSSKLLVILG